MRHEERVNLIQEGIANPIGLWADLGCGKGAFTLALAELLDAPAEIYAIDESKKALNEMRSSFKQGFPNLRVHFLEQDFTHMVDLPSLDGILMANALHYIKEKTSFIKRIRSYL